MDTSDSKISFDEHGVCDHCIDFEKDVKQKWFPNEEGKLILKKTVSKIKKDGKNRDFDCILGMSGGVDSSYMLHLAVKDLGLRPLVFHVDSGWNSEQAVKNIQLMIDKLDPNESTLIDKIKSYDESDYDSALFVQVSEEELSNVDTVKYQDFINRTMKENGYTHLKCICFNPNDKVDIDGFNARSHAPYFLINIASKKVLDSAHTTLAKTKYYDNMNQRYLKYLHKD